MVQTIGVTQAVTSLNEAHRKLALTPNGDPAFLRSGWRYCRS
jgi:hypothetical protein